MAGVVADGGTATTVATQANGHQVVTIAPAVAGVSHNTYSQFNVGAAGLDLDNSGVNARNIVNQVTGTNPSLIEGAITVLGPRANVILANPNGITVNGGSFVNTGNVALTTGTVSFNNYTVAGQPQTDIVLTTNQGTLTIGPGGLAGALLSLQLIAKNIEINGPVTNTYSNSNAGVSVVGGSSSAEINGTVSPTDNVTPWVSYSTPGISNPNAIVVDITPLGSLTSGKISMIVTDQGAAVRNAGAIYANAGDFTISGNGDLQVLGGSIQATGNVLINSASLDMSSGTNGLASIQAGAAINLDSTAISIADSTLNAGTDLLVGVSGQTTGAATTIANSTLSASGGIGFYNQNNAVNIAGSSVTAAQNLLLSAQSANLTAQWNGNTPQSTTLTSQTGIASFMVTDGLALSGAAVNGTGGTSVTAGNLSLATAYSADGSTGDRALLESSGGSVNVQTTGAVSLNGSDMLAAADLVINSASLSSANGSTLIAVNGAALVNSTGDIDNTGSLIQATQRDASLTGSQGAITLNAGGNILNQSPSESLLGAIFGRSDDVVLAAGGDITNNSGRIISNTALSLQAQGDINNVIGHQQGANGEQPQAATSQGTRWLILTENISSFNVDYGTVAMPNQLAYLVAGTDMTLSGRNINNYGGEMDANNGSINVTAANVFQNQAVFAGTASYSSHCLIFCHTSASSTIQSYGGLMSASQDIDITAGSEAANIGGRVLALNNLTVTAPITYATSVIGYTAYDRNAGLKAWFGDTWAQLYSMDIGGSWLANSGLLKINGQGLVNGGSFNGAQGVLASGGIVVSKAPQQQPMSIVNHLGLTSWFLR